MKKHIAEAYHYIDNANKIIKDNLKIEGQFYNDKKYIRMAGHTAYMAILVALEPLVSPEVRKLNKTHPDVFSYRQALGKKNKTALNLFNSAYNCLHMAMSYDGDLLTDTKKTGFKLANQLIEWADENTTALGGIKTKK